MNLDNKILSQGIKRNLHKLNVFNNLILAANGKYRQAIKVAQKSLELSIQADNQDYVKMNNDSIKEWSNK